MRKAGTARILFLFYGKNAAPRGLDEHQEISSNLLIRMVQHFVNGTPKLDLAHFSLHHEVLM
jgi:hypothetical protein